MFINLKPITENRDFRLLYFGQAISFFGSMLTYVAIPYQIYEITKSSFLVGLLGSVQLVPLLITALWGGAFADALDRRRLLVGSEILMSFASLMLVVSLYFPSIEVVALFVVSGFMSAVNGFHRPALEALTPQLVRKEDLPAIAALGSLRFNFGAIGGPALAGVLISKWGVASVYWIDVASFVFSLGALASIRSIPKVEHAERPSVGSILEGVRYAKSRPELIGTYLVDIIAMIFAMPMALFPSMAQNFGGAKAAGWLYSGMAIGSVTFSILSGWAGRIKRHGAVVIVAASFWGVAIIALGFANSLFVAVLCLALAGAADSVSGLYRGTIWNETIPSKLRGRLAGIEMLSYMTGPLLGNVRAGYVASISSNAISIISGGVLCVVGTLLCIVFLPKFWSYRSTING